MLNKIKKLWGLIITISTATFIFTSAINATLTDDDNYNFKTKSNAITKQLSLKLGETFNDIIDKHVQTDKAWDSFSQTINDLKKNDDIITIKTIFSRINEINEKKEYYKSYIALLSATFAQKVQKETNNSIDLKQFSNVFFLAKPSKSYTFSLKEKTPSDEFSKHLRSLKTALIEVFGLVGQHDIYTTEADEPFQQKLLDNLTKIFKAKIAQSGQEAEEHDTVPKADDEDIQFSTSGDMTQASGHRPASQPATQPSSGHTTPTIAANPAADKKPSAPTTQASEQKEKDAERPKVYFNQLIGIESIIEDVEQIVALIQGGDENAEMLGITPPRGILLDGPPGTGKTMLAQAIATESGVRFIEVDASTIMGQFVGSGPTKVAEIFQDAKKKAPCILFLDEIDAIGYSRESTKSSAEHQKTVVALLTAINEVNLNKLPIFILGATNYAANLDPALVRPGRFDRKITLDYLDATGRLKMLQFIRSKIKAYEDISDDFLRKIADDNQTHNYIAAELKNMFNQASVLFSNDMRKQAKKVPINKETRIPEKYLQEAFEVVKREHKGKAKAQVIQISRIDKPVNLAKSMLIELTSLHDCSTITNKLSSFLEETIKKDRRLPYSPEEKAGIASLVEQTEKMLDYVEDSCMIGEITVNIKLIDGAPSSQPGQFTLFGKTISITFAKKSASNKGKSEGNTRRKKNRSGKKSAYRKMLDQQRRAQFVMGKAQQQAHQKDTQLLNQTLQAILAQSGNKQTTVLLPVEEVERQLFVNIKSSSGKAAELLRAIVHQDGVIAGLLSTAGYSADDKLILKGLSHDINEILQYMEAVTTKVKTRRYVITAINATETTQQVTPDAAKSANENGTALKLGNKVFMITFSTEDPNKGAAEALAILKLKARQ